MLVETKQHAIVNMFYHLTDLKLPPAANQLENIMMLYPLAELHVLKHILSRKVKYTSKQDSCTVVTDGEWKPLKQIPVCMTVRHLYWRKKLTTLLNIFGYCESHLFASELVTPIA